MPILPIVTYDDQVLREKTQPIEVNSEELQQLIDNMFETMYEAQGVGLAAPQIGKSIQLFVVDANTMTKDLENEEDAGPLVFINPEILEKTGAEVKLEEGCLSIPEVRDDIARPESITIAYKDRDFNDRKIDASGWLSRVVQHEYDHLQGVLFLDYLSAFRRRLHKSTLKKIKKGILDTEYPLVSKKS